jgi:hypothetical protein
MAPLLKHLRPTVIFMWIVITESYNRLFKAKTAFSINYGNRNLKTMLPKDARMMFSGIVEV